MSSSERSTSLIRLTTDGRAKSCPVFTRGGTEIVYTVLESAAQMSLFRLILGEKTSERLHPSATTSEFEASYSADDRTCVFVQSRGNLNLKLIIRDTKLNRDALYNPGEGFACIRTPLVTPDGQRVIFCQPGPATQQIFSVNLDGQDRKTLTAVGLNSSPTFSPKGDRLAFASTRDGGFDIYSMNADGGDIQRLTRNPGLDIRPSWSPDGKRIAFTSNRDGRYQLYVMNPDGSGVRRLTDGPERDDYACWHPDGKSLLFVSERAGKADLYMTEVPVI